MPPGNHLVISACIHCRDSDTVTFYIFCSCFASFAEPHSQAIHNTEQHSTSQFNALTNSLDLNEFTKSFGWPKKNTVDTLQIDQIQACELRSNKHIYSVLAAVKYMNIWAKCRDKCCAEKSFLGKVWLKLRSVKTTEKFCRTLMILCEWMCVYRIKSCKQNLWQCMSSIDGIISA